MFSFHLREFHQQIELTASNLVNFSADEVLKKNYTNIFSVNLCKNLWADTSNMNYQPPCDTQLLNSGLETLLAFV